MYAIRVETLDYKESAVVLAVVLSYFDIDKKLSKKDLTENSLLVKLNVKEQAKNYKRTVLNNVIEYWKEQEPDIKKLVFIPSEKDLTLNIAFDKIDSYVKEHSSWKDYFWVDGFFSQMVYNNLAKNVGKLALFNNIRDFKTAYDILEVKDFKDFLDDDMIKSKNPIDVNVRNILRLVSNDA